MFRKTKTSSDHAGHFVWCVCVCDHLTTSPHKEQATRAGRLFLKLGQLYGTEKNNSSGETKAETNRPDRLTSM